jgi:hypothetical protein
MTLVEFLLARIADDAGIAESVSPPPWHAVDADDEAYIISQDFGEQVAVTDHLNVDHIMQWDPARVLAECEAKRQIIDMHTSTESVVRMLDALDNTADPVGNKTDPVALGIAQAALVTLEAVLKSHAQPYAEHPDYDEAWTFG